MRRLFSKLYQKVISWSHHHHAPYYLAGVAFVESSFFPVPPDIMLISMGLAKPKRVWFYALLATIFSVLGGVLGYFIGAFFLKIILPYFIYLGYEKTYFDVQHWFITKGVWIVFIAGLTPIPYKIFTIAAGATHMLMIPFVLASIAGRGCRFVLVSTVMYFGGEKIDKTLARHIDMLGWGALIVLGIGLMIWKLF